MGGKRLVDMSYTTSESAEVRPRSFNRKSDLTFPGDKGRDESSTPPAFLNGKYSIETEGDADTWSIEQDPPSSLPSAKFGYGDQKQDKHGVGHRHQHDRNNLDFQLGRNQRVTTKRNLQRGLTESFGETTDEEFMTNCITNISSASSSISWAEDAVEAELTKKIFGLWDDVQKVITGEINGKPDDMTNVVFEECLRWKRVFPIQNLDRFSKYSEDASTPTPIKNRHVISSRSTPNYKSSSPDSPNPLSRPICLTPNPEKNSDYVSLWLSDCRSRVRAMSSSQETIVQDNFNSLSLSQSDNKGSRSSTPGPAPVLGPVPACLNYHHPNIQTESDVTETRAFKFSHHPLPANHHSNTSNSSNSNNLKNLHLRYSTEASEPDPTNFFTQLALDDTMMNSSSNNSKTNTREYNEYHDRFSATSDTYKRPVVPVGRIKGGNMSNSSISSGGVANTLRVQRPISSNVKGHLITPLSTKLSHLPHPPSSLSLSKSFREQSFTNSSNSHSNSKSNFNSNSTLPPKPFHHPLSSASSYPQNFKYPHPNHTEDEEEEQGGPFGRHIPAVDSGNESSDNCYFPNFSMPMSMSMSVSSPNRSIKSKSTATSSHPVFLPTIPSSPSYSGDQRSSGPTRQRPFSKSTRTSTSISVSNNNNNISCGIGGNSSNNNNNNNSSNSAYVKSRMFDYISDSGSGSGLERMKYTGPKGPSSVSSNQSNHVANRGLMSGNSGIGSASSSSGGGGGIGGRTANTSETGAAILINGLNNGTNWSRHSSISDSFSLKLQNNTNAFTNSNSISNSNSNTNNFPILSDTSSLNMLGMGSGITTTTTTTTTTSDGINDDYFPHQLYPSYDMDSHLDTMNLIKLRRPDFLAVSKDAEFAGLSTSSSSSAVKSKPVRPFLYWLLDKVSPS